MYRFKILLLGAYLSIVCGVSTAAPKEMLWINEQSVYVEVVASQAERTKGLMYRKTLPEGEGMLFVFDPATKPCFWMKNTFIPLSLAYISEAQQIVQLADLEPHSERLVCATQTIRYALEVPKGWYDKHGIHVGNKIKRSGQ